MQLPNWDALVLSPDTVHLQRPARFQANSVYGETYFSADLSAEENEADSYFDWNAYESTTTTGQTETTTQQQQQQRQQQQPGDILSTSASPALAAKTPRPHHNLRRLRSDHGGASSRIHPHNSLPEHNDEPVNEASEAGAGQKRRREDDDGGADHVKRVYREPQVEVAVQAEIPGTTHPAPCADVLPPQPVPNAGPSQESAPPSGQPPEMSCTLPQGGSDRTSAGSVDPPRTSGSTSKWCMA
ncbi:uncharacterized protein B0H18DRAFT_1127796 [Fomitopsis serialis]|uniref:uncharacterized protein n=1 Tax=Fomitopsis serialis TaxID=139415 RepID=UPI0020089334|nr:uncharacterized protein B0H18DRAFT_1127796 [Neoantrodia serialis]KAH9911974.1 hypothetical protein B0H18DRAFT_1127796 [Neoantrodia serialis]